MLTSRYLCACPDLDYFRFADNTLQDARVVQATWARSLASDRHISLYTTNQTKGIQLKNTRASGNCVVVIGLGNSKSNRTPSPGESGE